MALRASQEAPCRLQAGRDGRHLGAVGSTRVEASKLHQRGIDAACSLTRSHLHIVGCSHWTDCFAETGRRAAETRLDWPFNSS